MANPQIENGHVKIACEIVEQLARVNLSAYEWRVLWCVLRKTYGWHKKLDTIPLSQIAKMTGIQRPHVVEAKMRLLQKRILFARDGKIGFQKDYEQWQVKGYTSTDLGTGSTDSGTTLATQVVPIQVIGGTDSGTKSGTDSGTLKSNKATTQQQQRAEAAKSFREYWNSKVNLPRIKSMTDDRRKKLAARMKEPDFRDNWRQIIDRIAASSFCRGGGKKGWRADVDWLLGNSTNYVKTLEGKYDDSLSAAVPLVRDAEGKTPEQRILEKMNGN